MRCWIWDVDGERCLSRLRLGGQAARAGEEGRPRGHVRRGADGGWRPRRELLRALAGQGRAGGQAIRFFPVPHVPPDLDLLTTIWGLEGTKVPIGADRADSGPGGPGGIAQLGQNGPP